MVYDSMPAASVAEGRAVIPSCALLGSLLRAEAEAAGCQASARWEHVHSHIGMPWNEAVDGLAEFRSKGGQCLQPPTWAWPSESPTNFVVPTPRGA